MNDNLYGCFGIQNNNKLINIVGKGKNEILKLSGNKNNSQLRMNYRLVSYSDQITERRINSMSDITFTQLFCHNTRRCVMGDLDATQIPTPAYI